MSNINVICIDTGFSRYASRDVRECALSSVENVKSLIESPSEGRFLVTLDVFHDRIRDFLNIIEKHYSKIIVFSIKHGRVRRFYRRFLGDPLRSLLNTDYAVGLFIDKSSGSNESKVKYVDIRFRFEDFFRVFSIKSPRLLGYLAVKTTRLIKFILVGLSGYLVNLLSAYGLRSILETLIHVDLATMLASALSIELSITWNYIWHEMWTFSDVDKGRGVSPYVLRWIYYNFGSIGSISTQLLSVYVLTVLYNKPLYLSLTIGVLLGFTINYAFSRMIVWRRRG